MKQTCIKLLSAMLFAFSFLSCGGGGIPSIVEGGIGGTGIGMVTGFGSVIINDDRTFQVNGDTVIRVDDSPMSETEFRNVGVGMVVRVDVSDDVNSNFTAGTAVNIIADNQVKGPVTSTSPLEVLGQTVLVTGDTVLVNVPGNDVANLVADDLVEISGFVSTTGVIQATRLEFKNALLEWKIEGYVSAVAGSNFSIGNQMINPNGITLRDCPGTLSIGQLIEVKASPDIDRTTLDTLTDAECKTPGLQVPAGTSGSVLRAEVEGLVNEIITDGSEYRINGQHVIISGATVFENGTLEDLLLGARVEAEGSFNTTTGILNANKIEFREVRVRIESLVDNVDSGNNALTMFGVIDLRITDLTEFNGNLTSLADINLIDKYEVRGFVDGDNTVYITRIRDRNVDNLVRLRGPVASGCDTSIMDYDIDILGVTIYVNDVPAAEFRDQTGTVITREQFCTATATVGQPVNVEDGVYTPSPSRISNANLIELED